MFQITRLKKMPKNDAGYCTLQDFVKTSHKDKLATTMEHKWHLFEGPMAFP